MAERICGIYFIKNIVNNKLYIGQSNNIYKRWNNHKNDLKNNRDSKYLQSSYNKYGEENFVYGILELCEPDLLDWKEMNYIIMYNSRDYQNGYNLTDGGSAPSGYRHTQETKALFSKILIGNKRRLGKPSSEEEKIRMSISRKGKPGKSGWNQTKETREKMSKSKTGVLGLKKKFSSSKYIGVKFNKKRRKWESWIWIEKSGIYLGIFQFEIEAALAYNEAAYEYFGYKAKVNKISNEEILDLWNKKE